MDNKEKKIIGYDPNTGFPIYEEVEERKILRFNTETGEPIYEENEVEKKIIGYNPNTGEPIYEKPSNIVGYNPNTGEPIYSNNSNLMEDRKTKKIIGYDTNTGFPIYDTNNINQNNVKRVTIIKSSGTEKLLLTLTMIALVICFFGGFINVVFGTLLIVIMVSYIILEAIIYHNQFKKSVPGNFTLKLSTSTKVLGIVFIVITIIGMINYLYDLGDDNNPGAGWYAILIFWPGYILMDIIFFILGGAFLSKLKRDSRKCFNIIG